MISTTVRVVRHVFLHFKTDRNINRAIRRKAFSSKMNIGTLSNFDKARVTHLDWTFDIDFEQKIIEGYAIWNAQVEQDGSDKLTLDVLDLDILRTDLISENDPQKTSFELSEGNALGKGLSIDLGKEYQKGETVRVGVHYKSLQGSEALHFLEPAQTMGKIHPYLFTECEMIKCRAMLPCQDAPRVKFTYAATVRVKEPLTALMAAIQIDDHENHFAWMETEGKEGKLFHYQQKAPIPSYLVAFVAGELESREIGPRTRVWSEPKMVDAGAFEFANTESYLAAGEAIMGEYVWGRYDLLLLPPSFGLGGMENPCLTFVTPTLLAGDRSLTNVIAHEIAHSWTGNLVSNASWGHFWINEGFTRLVETKIVGRVAGRGEAGFLASSGYLQMKKTVERFGKDHPYTQLVIIYEEGVDPNEGFSNIPYEKGFHFLYYLETVVGGEDVFEPFLRAYIQRFKFQSITSDDFKDFFIEYFKHKDCNIDQIDWEKWFYSRGMPPIENIYDTSLMTEPYGLAKKWHTSDLMGIGGQGPKDASKKDIEGWSSSQLIGFLAKLCEMRGMKALHKSITRKMNELYQLDEIRNSEVRAKWCVLCIEAEDEAILENAKAFVSEQGRMKFLKPIYRALYKSKMGKDIVGPLFEQNKPFYTPWAISCVAKEMQ